MERGLRCRIFSSAELYCGTLSASLFYLYPVSLAVLSVQLLTLNKSYFAFFTLLATRKRVLSFRCSLSKQYFITENTTYTHPAPSLARLCVVPWVVHLGRNFYLPISTQTDFLNHLKGQQQSVLGHLCEINLGKLSKLK